VNDCLFCSFQYHASTDQQASKNLRKLAGKNVLTCLALFSFPHAA